MRPAALLLVLLAACGTTHHAKAPTAEEARELDHTWRDESGSVWLAAEKAPRPARVLALAPDGVFWRDPEGKGWSQPYSGVRQISRTSHAVGFFQGLGIGLLSGAAVGAAIGATGGSDQCPTGRDTYFCITKGGSIALGAILLGVTGGLLGGLIGGVAGSEQKVLFDRQ